MSTGPGISGRRIVLKLRETEHCLVNIRQTVQTGKKSIAESVAFQVQTYDEHSVAELEVVESCLLSKDLPQAAERRKAGDDLLPKAPTEVDDHMVNVGRCHPETLQD